MENFPQRQEKRWLILKLWFLGYGGAQSANKVCGLWAFSLLWLSHDVNMEVREI